MNLTAILPELSLFFGAVIILMSDVFFGKKFKEFFYVSHLLALIFCTVCLTLVIRGFAISEISFYQMFINNPLITFVKAFTVTLLTVVILFSLKFLYFNQRISAEFLALMMISTVGAMFLISSNDFLTFYLALELQGLSLTFLPH